MREDFLWVEKYRPKKIQDTILPFELKEVFQQFIDQGNIPNLILSGGPGVGKTTVARAMLEELQYQEYHQANPNDVPVAAICADGIHPLRVPFALRQLNS